MAKVLVRLSMFAEPVEVDEDEIGHLRSQGLVVEDAGEEGGVLAGDPGKDGNPGGGDPVTPPARKAARQQ